MIDAAIKPEIFQSPYEKLVEDKARERGNSEEEIVLSDLSHTSGWQLIVEEMDAIIAELEGSLASQMEAGASFEDIGRSAVVKEIVKSYIIRIKNKTNDAKEAVQGGK